MEILNFRLDLRGRKCVQKMTLPGSFGAVDCRLNQYGIIGFLIIDLRNVNL